MRRAINLDTHTPGKRESGYSMEKDKKYYKTTFQMHLIYEEEYSWQRSSKEI